jgi:hypothetical protein
LCRVARENNHGIEVLEEASVAQIAQNSPRTTKRSAPRSPGSPTVGARSAVGRRQRSFVVVATVRPEANADYDNGMIIPSSARYR